MKSFENHAFDSDICQQEFSELSDWLATHPKLDEANDIAPFFRQHPNLSLFLSRYANKMTDADLLAYEFPIFGDFVADLVVGNSRSHNYLLVEFEDAHPESIFRPRKGKNTPEWAPRFEHAFSQVLDWLWKLEDMRSTANFEHVFANRHAKFHGLIITGKDMNLAAREQARLRWRLDRVLVDSNTISCISFDELREDLRYWLN